MSRMVPYQENDTALFLYAILKQVKVRDVDWSAVAQDPILLRPIPNGHAARMRYLRFRNSLKVKPPIREELEGLETKPRRRSRKKTTKAASTLLEVLQPARGGDDSQTRIPARSWQYHKAAFSTYPSPPPIDPYDDDRLGGPNSSQSGVLPHGISRCFMPTELDHAIGGLVSGLDRGEGYFGHAGPCPAIDCPSLYLDSPGEEVSQKA